MDTIFLSSTCYDLTDLRSVLINSLTAEGFTTIASDVSSSDFTLFPQQNSIEICVTNVGRSDLFLLILDRRYGPPVPAFGGKSATHIEYEAAIEHHIPVLTFVRRAFLSDHRVWQKMTSAGQTAAEVAKALGYVEKTARGDTFEFVALFTLFDSVRRASERGKNNWVESFDTAHELSQLALRRSREILQAESLHIQANLRSIAASPSPVSLSVEYVTKATSSLGQITLNDRELRMLADAALDHGIAIAPIVGRMSNDARTAFLTALAPRLIDSDAGAATMMRFKSPAITEAIRAWFDGQSEFKTCMTAFQRLGLDLDFFTDRLRTLARETLWQVYDVTYFGFQENAHELFNDKLSALRLIGRVGDARDLSAVLRCLLERGIPTLSGDPEHINSGDPPSSIHYVRKGDEIVKAAKETFLELHQRNVCLQTALPEGWLSQLRCSPLRINIARTLISVCDHITPEQSRAMVSAIIQSNADDELCDELLQECAEHGIDLEGILLDFLQRDPKLISRSIVGLIWHATNQALPQLIDFVNTCDEQHLPKVAYVLRFLVGGSTRQTIVEAFRHRMTELQVKRDTEAYTMAEIVSSLGVRELLPVLNTSGSSAYEVTRRGNVVKNVEEVELARESGLRRAKFWVVVRSWSQKAFVAAENACIEEARSISSCGPRDAG